MTVLVTGATGKVGREVLAALRCTGTATRAGSRRSEIPLDWADESGWDAALADIDSVFLLVPGGDDGHRDVTGLGGSVKRFVAHTARRGVSRVVLMTALGMQYAPPEVELRALELAVQDSGMEWTILRPNWFHQNFADGMLHDLAAGNNGVLELPVGEAGCSFVDTRDIAAVAAAALAGGHDGREYDLTGGEAWTFSQIAQLAASTSLSLNEFRSVSDEAFRAAVRQRGWDEAYVEQLNELFGMIEAGHSEVISADVPRVLGREPIALRDFFAG